MTAQLPSEKLYWVEGVPEGWRVGQTLVNFIRWCEENYGQTCYYWSDKKTQKEYRKFIGEVGRQKEKR